MCDALIFATLILLLRLIAGTTIRQVRFYRFLNRGNQEVRFFVGRDAQGTVQGYLIHRDNTILDLALAPQADAEQVSAALLGRMRAAGCTHATLAKVPENEPIGSVLACLGFTPTADYLLMGQDLQ